MKQAQKEKAEKEAEKTSLACHFAKKRLLIGGKIIISILNADIADQSTDAIVYL